jgi:hypothetical protein
MAWNQEAKDPIKHTPISVRKAGFAGLVGDQGWDDEMKEAQGGGDHDDWDEDLFEDTTPEPTHEEQQHHEEHGEYPESHYERHDQAYGEALRKKHAENDLDHDDPALMHFVGEHGQNTHLWQNKGHLGMVSLKDKPVYATQSHVSKEHIQRYLDDPRSTAYHLQRYGPGAGDDYLGHDTPMFVTHEGRLHTTEGHHRVAAALQRGDDKIHAWHFDLDKHPQYGEPDED